ncbi:MAG: Gx transporter family protein [Clostridia bacterium]|nr:Gx transporter family protein [Clostridia bacterium]
MKDNRRRIRRITMLALCTSAALLLSYVEMLIPPIFTGIPGIKMGLPNIAILLVLYRAGAKEAAAVSFIRIVITSILFGNITMFWYSLAGATLSLAVMILLKRIDILSSVGVSVAGALAHNVGQIIVAMILMQTSQLGYYLIVLSITGAISGIFVGLLGGYVIKRISKIEI